MVRINIPFGKGTVSFNVPSSNLLGVVEPKKVRGIARPGRKIQRALSKPIGSFG